MDDIICPVPKAQRPLDEYKEISNSWFFSWPTKTQTVFYKKLIISWIIMFTIASTISFGSLTLKQNLPLLIITSYIEAFLLPILILTRQWMSWRYIFNRLVDEKIEYEESGWYDGQIWIKPASWKDKEFIVAIHDVKPILKKLVSTVRPLTLLILFGFSTVLLYTSLN